MWEFVWVLPLLLFTLGLVFDFSVAMYADHFVAYAAREGARWASVRGGSCIAPMTPCPALASDIQTYVKGLAPPAIIANNLTIDTTTTDIWPGVDADGYVNSGGTCSISTPAGCSPCSPPPSDSPGCVVSVKVQYNYKFFILNIFERLSGGTWTGFNISSTSAFTISQ